MRVRHESLFSLLSALSKLQYYNVKLSLSLPSSDARYSRCSKSSRQVNNSGFRPPILPGPHDHELGFWPQASRIRDEIDPGETTVAISESEAGSPTGDCPLRMRRIFLKFCRRDVLEEGRRWREVWLQGCAGVVDQTLYASLHLS